MKNTGEINIIDNKLVYLPESKALITFSNSKKFLEDPDAEPKEIGNKKIKYVPWGDSNSLPQTLIKKCGKSPVISANHNFNITVGYGEGIKAVRFTKDKNNPFEIVTDNEEINTFFENNDINGYLLEQLNDINYFNIAFSEIILNQDKPNSRKVVELTSKEAVFSRWGEANKKTGKIEKHIYSAKFSQGKDPEKENEYEITDVLDNKNPILDLKRKIGREKYPNLKIKDDKIYRYIIPVSLPTPGRVYYPKPVYYSIFESGWYDFATQIPEFKKALMENQATIKYIVYLTENYFTNIFSEEGITTDVDRKARIKKEYENINNYLTNTKNAGKAVISKIKYSPEGKEMSSMKVTVLDNKFKGGEYIEDSEEVSNIMSYVMGVHPSLVGSAPGKNKNINGTEARELFIIKHAMMKPIRDRILKPLYLIKAINDWPKDIHFIIPSMKLTTLDKNKSGIEINKNNE